MEHRAVGRRVDLVGDLDAVAVEIATAFAVNVLPSDWYEYWYRLGSSISSIATPRGDPTMPMIAPSGATCHSASCSAVDAGAPGASTPGAAGSFLHPTMATTQTNPWVRVGWLYLE